GLAVLLPAARWPRRFLNPRIPGALARVLGWSGLVGLGLVAVLYDSETPFPGTAAILPVIATVMVLRAGTSAPGEKDGALRKFLSLRFMQTIGKLSYSWYLWHWPILVFAAALIDPVPFAWRLVAVTVSLVLAYASYTFVEDPIRHSRSLAGSPAGSLAMGAAISISAVAAAGLWWGAAREWSVSDSQNELTRVSTTLPAVYYNQACDYGDRSSEVHECVYGDTTSSNTVLLIGDSHAMQFFPALRGAADENGWRLVVLTKSGCPFVDIPARYSPNLGRVYVECEIWREKAVDVVARIAPTLTFAGSSTQYRVEPAEWEEGTRSVLSGLARGSGRVVQILDPPVAAIDIPSCLARAVWRWDPLDPDCRPRGKPRTDLLVAAQEKAARTVPGVEILDLRDEVCVIGECGAMEGELVRYRDDDHLSVEFALTLTPVFVALLNGTQELSRTP
ncbi:MAG: acyltransferase family protein, partial [Gemmatimonadales bacterium]